MILRFITIAFIISLSTAISNNQCENCEVIHYRYDHQKKVLVKIDSILKYDVDKIINRSFDYGRLYIENKDTIWNRYVISKDNKLYFTDLSADTCYEIFSFDINTKKISKVTNFKSILSKNYNFIKFSIEEKTHNIIEPNSKFYTTRLIYDIFVKDLILFVFVVRYHAQCDYYFYKIKESNPFFTVKSSIFNKIATCNNTICMKFTEVESKLNWWYLFFFWVREVYKWDSKLGDRFTYVFDNNMNFIEKIKIKDKSEHDD